MTLEEIARLETLMARKLGASAATLHGLRRIHGGASRETFSFDMDLTMPAGAERRGFILRRDPPGSLIETERLLEFEALQSFAGRIPAPHPILAEPRPEMLGAAFLVMERIDGGTAASPFQHDPYGPHAEAIGRQVFSILGQIAGADVAATRLPLISETPTPESCWAKELDHWSAVLSQDSQGPNPIADAAIRWLRDHPPPPAQKISFIHGDYRSGNFLHDGAGRVLAILDWEMAHIGDPLEDLAWALDPLWAHFEENAGGMLAIAEAIAIWSRESGLRVDPDALAWWRLFASLKGLAIWTSAGKAFTSGVFDPVLAVSNWYCTSRHELILAQRLDALHRGAVS